MIYILIWLASSVVAFLVLRHFALRDFGVVTVGGAILMGLGSLLTPCALMVLLSLYLAKAELPFDKVLWTREKR